MTDKLDPRAQEVDRLLQTKLRAEIEQIGTERWLTVYRYSELTSGEPSYFCGLVPKRAIKTVMSAVGWELRIGDGQPGFSTRYGGARPRARYHRFGSDSPVEPLVFVRDFHEVRPTVVELSEEFRHGMNLFEDRATGKYWRLDDAGEGRVVAEVSREVVRIETRAMRLYLASRDMALIVYFDCGVRSELELRPEDASALAHEHDDDALVYSLAVSHSRIPGSSGSFSSLMGKRLVTPPKVAERWIAPFEPEPEHYVSFVIGADANGENVSFSCDPDALANYFGKNPTAPHHLTPVVFRREVLKKYLDHPEKYLVEDGLLRRGALWSMRIDNDAHDRVTAFLGDLGADLPYQEQLHWASYNVAPFGDGKDLSRTNVERSFNANFWDPNTEDLVFKTTLADFQERWRKKYEWDLVRPLPPADAHVLTKLRVPVVESIVEFDEQVLGLAKILGDSLDSDGMAREVGEGPRDERGIARFKRFLVHHKCALDSELVELLPLIQRVRSTSVAHLKGREFQKVATQLGLRDGKKFSEVFTGLLRRAIALLTALALHFEL